MEHLKGPANRPPTTVARGSFPGPNPKPLPPKMAGALQSQRRHSARNLTEHSTSTSGTSTVQESRMRVLRRAESGTASGPGPVAKTPEGPGAATLGSGSPEGAVVSGAAAVAPAAIWAAGCQVAATVPRRLLCMETRCSSCSGDTHTCSQPASADGNITYKHFTRLSDVITRLKETLYNFIIRLCNLFICKRRVREVHSNTNVTTLVKGNNSNDSNVAIVAVAVNGVATPIESK